MNIPAAPRPFKDVRAAALARWSASRLGPSGEPVECEWQAASIGLPHDCAAPNCSGETHVSLYCSLNETIEHLDDVLTDTRFDRLVLGEPGVGDPTGLCGDPESALGRFFIRVLRTADIVLDDLEAILKESECKGNLRTQLSQRAPLDVSSLRGFTNNVGKHGAGKPLGIHRWNQHAPYFFDDALSSPAALDGWSAMRAAPGLGGATPEAVLFPTLSDVVNTVACALRNADAWVRQPLVLAKLAGRFGGCA